MHKATRLVLLLCIPLLVLVDQLSKWWVIEMILRPRVFEAQGASQSFLSWLTSTGQELFPPAQIPVTEFFNIVMVWNKGVSFGMFASHAEWMPYILSGFALIIAAVMFVWFLRVAHLTIAVPLVMIIAGAISNVWDRVRFGAVADFLDFYLGDWHYPAFNIADCCIVVGVIVLAFDSLILEPRRSAKADLPPHLKGDTVSS